MHEAGVPVHAEAAPHDIPGLLALLQSVWGAD